MNTVILKRFKGYLFLISLFTANMSAVFALENDQSIANKSSAIEQWYAVSDTKLENLRAGFVLSNGVIVDISFEKRVFINDVERSNSYFQTPQNVSLVKNGELNISSDFQDSLFQSVIQNNLDNQILKTIHTINIDIKNLGNAKNALNNSDFYNQFFLPSTHQ